MLRPRSLSCFVACLVLVASSSFADESIARKAAALEESGQFQQAEAMLKQALEKEPGPSTVHDELVFELDRLPRIKRDFSLTEADLFKLLQKGVKDLTEDEYRQWIREGRFDSRMIDGARYYMHSSVRNLFYRYPELDPRRLPPRNDVANQKLHLQIAREVTAAARKEGKPYVLPKKFDVTFSGTVAADVVPAGETIRAWLPIPRAFPFQREFEVKSTSPPPSAIAPVESPVRSIYFEQPAKSGEKAEFQMTISFIHDGVHFEIDPQRVTRFDGKDESLTAFTKEAEHVVFTPELRELSKQIVGDETNPALVARKLYDWIGHNIRYSLAIEYSTIRNISDYCRKNRFGDCGQEGMLFIALCRLNGVPARWQSGWNLFPNANNIHDWTEIFLAPYGWMPVDPYMSLYARQYAPDLTPAEQQEVADFYFGGLDQYRMEANSDHSTPLTPAKKAPRSDTVDFQRGEFEWGDKNLYYDAFKWSFTVKESPAK